MFLAEKTRTPETPRIGKPPGNGLQSRKKASSARQTSPSATDSSCRKGALLLQGTRRKTTRPAACRTSGSLPDRSTWRRQANPPANSHRRPGSLCCRLSVQEKTPRSCSPPPASSGELFPSITRMKHKSPSQRTMKRNTAEKRAAGALHVIEELQKHLDPWLSHDSGERPRQKYCYATE